MEHLEKLPNTEYVYVIQDIDISGYYKIGRTSNPSQRMATFGVQLPFRTAILRVIPCENSRRVEDHLHNHFHFSRKNGEWFDLNENQVVWLLQFDPKTIDTISIPKYAYSVQHEVVDTNLIVEKPYEVFSGYSTKHFVKVSWVDNQPYISWSQSPSYPVWNIGELKHRIYEDVPPTLENAKRFLSILHTAIEQVEKDEPVIEKDQTA